MFAIPLYQPDLGVSMPSDESSFRVDYDTMQQEIHEMIANEFASIEIDEVVTEILHKIPKKIVNMVKKYNPS